MTLDKTTFALFFGNRGLFPASLIADARRELAGTLERLGHRVLMLDDNATRYGAVETPKEGAVYADFLRQNRGKYGGVILCLPNFGDETGAVAALKDAGVPILIQAYPDELNRMAPEVRRDSFCGKFSIMDVFYQYGVKFTALKPHVVHPTSDAFAQNVDYFDRMCRVVNGLRNMTVGAIGARTTPFKTVRIDELALQRHGITVETVDMADVIGRVRELADDAPAVAAKSDALRSHTRWGETPPPAFLTIAKLGVVLDQLIEEMGLDALAIRCWLELQKQLGISPCVLLSELNDRFIAAACEVDVGNAVTMRALSLASGYAPACLDWNNNYGNDDEQCILFHCGPVPQSLMAGKGCVTDHSILANVTGPGCGWGCNQGRIMPMPVTVGGLMTEAGRMKFYVGEGRITDDEIPPEFFGCAGVFEQEHLQDTLLTIGKQGHRHHVSLTRGHVAAPLVEALEGYLGCDVTRV
ncbi:MAG: hypothetical protein GX446_16150 [Chthonomonadales bacterium]|nr:hypothetical protein [Chthonomonadales bacterium]